MNARRSIDASCVRRARLARRRIVAPRPSTSPAMGPVWQKHARDRLTSITRAGVCFARASECDGTGSALDALDARRSTPGSRLRRERSGDGPADAPGRGAATPSRPTALFHGLAGEEAVEVVCERRRRSVSIGGVLLDAVQYDALELARNARVHSARARRLALEHGEEPSPLLPSHPDDRRSRPADVKLGGPAAERPLRGGAPSLLVQRETSAADVCACGRSSHHRPWKRLSHPDSALSETGFTSPSFRPPAQR